MLASQAQYGAHTHGDPLGGIFQPVYSRMHGTNQGIGYLAPYLLHQCSGCREIFVKSAPCDFGPGNDGVNGDGLYGMFSRQRQCCGQKAGTHAFAPLRGNHGAVVSGWGLAGRG